jgi:hypothetical protein
VRKIAVIALGVACACTPIRPRPSPTATTNACPDHPCSAYSTGSPGSPACASGVCLQPATASATHLVLLVAIPVDARTLPGQTFAVSFAGVDLSHAPSDGTPPPLPLKPRPARPSGSYLVQASTTLPPPQGLGWNLGNLDTAKETSLPVHVTYRPLWPPPVPAAPGAADAGPPSRTDAIAAGLPLYPVQVESVPTSVPGAIGPAQGPAMGFLVALEQGLLYEQSIAPDAPFDQAYPPDVSIVQLESGDSEKSVFLNPDKTVETTKEGSAVLPSFDISRIDGPLDGWSAYLRDATTRRAISPIRPLSGMTTTGVLLPTSHHPVADALENAELVVAPPGGQPLPTYVEAPRGKQFSAKWTYPPLPPPTMVRGRIDWSDFQPGAADVVFEATGIYAALPPVDPGDAGFIDAGADGGTGGTGDAGPNYTLQPGNFEYTAQTTANPDPTVVGSSTYEITLPRGNYRVIVRPRDTSLAASQPTGHEVSIFEGIDIGSAGEAHPAALFVDVTRRIAGTAVVADGRALSGAIVEALPIHCSMPSGLVRTTKDAPSCMPRYQSTITADNGAFSLLLDPGDYLIRAEPADGTRLPWVSQAVHVPGSSSVTLTIPAPTYRGFELQDWLGNAISDAVVRMFTTVNGPAVEVGRAMTNATGRFDMYIDPRIQ